jgi:hypothetical protein
VTTVAGPARPDTEVVFDPATYTGGVPFEALARLRRDTPVTWVPEIPVLGWPEGPGFWLVLRQRGTRGKGLDLVSAVAELGAEAEVPELAARAGVGVPWPG